MSPPNGSRHTTEELLGRLRTGDRDAFATLYRTFHDSLWRLAVLLTRRPDTAHDVVHDVFLALWTRRDTLAVHGDLRVYLFAAVRHHVYNVHRRDKLAGAVEQASEQGIIDVPGIGAPSGTPESSVEAAEFRTAYARAVAMLAERDRVAILLRWDEGLTFEQIGQVLGMSNVGARALVLRVQSKIQDALAEFRR